MFHVRAALSADYAVTPNLIDHRDADLVLVQSGNKGLRTDITSITAIDFMVGLGYRM